MDTYDVLVLGAGPAGEVAAQRAAAGGLTVAAIEREKAGGECSYWACIPSKALLHPGDALELARRAPGAREVTGERLAPDAVLAFRDRRVHGYNDQGDADWLSKMKVTLIRGHGRLVGERRVDVTTGASGTRPLMARRAVIIATGSRARLPDIPGLRDARPWTSREGTSSKRVPRRLVVLGGGVVGVELAHAWRSLGAEVDLVHRGKHLVARTEPFAQEAVARGLREAGVRLHLESPIERVERKSEREVVVTLAGGTTLRGDEVLGALGREPATHDLGLETIGLTPGEPIEVDDRLLALRVKAGWLFAIGDVNGRNPLTHMGKYQGRVAGDQIAGKPTAPAWADQRAVPQVVFTRPPVASVGLTEAAAHRAGLDVRVVRRSFEDVAGSWLLGEGWAGEAQLVVDAQRGVLVGATFVGPTVHELLHSATIAVAGEVPLERLWHAVPVFPTVSEIWLRLLEAYGL
jgi:dihydrolipoamide dehydrogenase